MNAIIDAYKHHKLAQQNEHNMIATKYINHIFYKNIYILYKERVLPLKYFLYDMLNNGGNGEVVHDFVQVILTLSERNWI